jgi:hypothetical protein
MLTLTLTLTLPSAQVYALTTFLRERGAEAVPVADLTYVFSKDKPAAREAGSGAVATPRRNSATLREAPSPLMAPQRTRQVRPTQKTSDVSREVQGHDPRTTVRS